jgi:hypothetical protein
VLTHRLGSGLEELSERIGNSEGDLELAGIRPAESATCSARAKRRGSRRRRSQQTEAPGVVTPMSSDMLRWPRAGIAVW